MTTTATAAGGATGSGPAGSVPAGGGAFAPPLPALYLVSALAGMASGLFNPLIATRMTERGASEWMVGINTSVFFLGMMLAAPLVRGRGARGTVTVGLGVTALAALLFPHHDHPAVWFALRAVMGLGVGAYMVASQTALNDSVADDRRALVGGIYALAFGLGFGLGPLLGAAIYRWRPDAAFAGGAALLALGLAVVWSRLPSLRLVPERPRLALLGRLASPALAVLAYGVAESVLVALYPVQAHQRGLDVLAMGYGFTAFVVGGIAATLPAGHLADRFGHERLLLACALGGATAMGVAMQVEGVIATVITSALVGASVGPLFAVSLAIVGKRLPRDLLSSGSALFTMMLGLGSMLGPAVGALCMRWLGPAHMFTPCIALLLVLVVVVLLDAPARREVAESSA